MRELASSGLEVSPDTSRHGFRRSEPAAALEQRPPCGRDGPGTNSVGDGTEGASSGRCPSSVSVLHALHLLGEPGGVFLVLDAVDLEGAEHVIGVLEVPALARVGVGELCRVPLQVLLVQRIRTRRVDDVGGPSQTTFDEVAREAAVLTQRDPMLFPFDGAGDRYVTNLGLGRCFSDQHLLRERLQSVALLGVRLRVNVEVVEIPLPEGIHHRLPLRALDHASHRKAVQRDIPVAALLDEQELAAAAGHARRLRSEPARACGIAGAGFLELPHDPPWLLPRLVFLRLREDHRSDSGGKNEGERHKRSLSVHGGLLLEDDRYATLGSRPGQAEGRADRPNQSSDEWTISPATIVATGPPRRRQPPKGVFRLSEWNLAGSTENSRSKSRTVISAGEAGVRVPPARTRERSGLVDDSATHPPHRTNRT